MKGYSTDKIRNVILHQDMAAAVKQLSWQPLLATGAITPGWAK